MGANKTRISLMAALFAGLMMTAPTSGQVIEDIIVLMDSSGSLGGTGWSNAQDFVIELNHAMPNRAQSRLGIIRFASTVTTAYNLTGSQSPPSIIDSVVNGLSYTGGNCHTKDAIQQAISIFDAQSPVTNSRALILITDGPPNPIPAQDPSGLMAELASRGIPLVVVGHTSGFSSSPYSYATTTGGNVYAYSTIGDETVEQFLSDAGQYFGLVGLQGDFNGDDEVNATDYVAWRKNSETGDYDVWKQHFGTTLTEGGSGVPEPTTIAQFGVMLLLVSAPPHRRS